MENVEPARAVQAPNVLKWILSSGVIAAGVAVWGTLLGLLFRTGWLSAFGVAEDLFIPSSATELTYWGYVALLELWLAVSHGLYEAFIKLAAISILAGAMGLLVGFLSLKYKSALGTVLQKKAARVSLSLFVALGTLVLYPAVIFLVATTLLLLPSPAYSVGKKAAERAIEKYRNDVSSGRRNCHVLLRPNGQVGTCPMVIAQTTEHIAFLDGSRVHVVPSEGLQINWVLPLLAQPAKTTER